MTEKQDGKISAKNNGQKPNFTRPSTTGRLPSAIPRMNGVGRPYLKKYGRIELPRTIVIARSRICAGKENSEIECAFRWLEKGFEERDDLMIDLKVEPGFDAIWSDPRYQDLVRRVGIPQ